MLESCRKEARVLESVAAIAKKKNGTIWDINGHDKISLRLEFIYRYC